MRPLIRHKLSQPAAIIRARTALAFNERVPNSLRVMHAEGVLADLAAAGYHVVQEGQAVVVRTEAWNASKNEPTTHEMTGTFLRPLTDEGPRRRG